MEREQKIAFVTDSGTSMLPKSPEAIALDVTVIPLETRFFENGKYVPYSDEDFTTEEFYSRMLSSKMLPETVGGLPNKFVEAFKKLRDDYSSIISVNITSEESAVYQSAVTAKNIVLGENGQPVDIKVKDSKLVSLAAWYPLEAGVNTYRKGGSMKDIEDEIEEAIKKSQLFVTLESFHNLLKGGRARQVVQAFFGSIMSKYPVLGLVDGRLKALAIEYGVQNARNRMFQMVGDSGKIFKLAILHTNVPFLARKTRESMKNIFGGNIPIYNIKGALAVHAGVGALGIALQKA